jgi:hypothetical protein
VLLKFCPAIRHWPDRASGELLCALSAEPNKRTPINAAAGNDTLRFFLNICIFSFHAVKENLRKNPARASTVHSGAHRAQAQISRRSNSLLLQHHRLSIVDILRNRSIDSRGDRRQRPYTELAGQDSAEESALFVLVTFCSLLHGLAT